MSTTVNNADDFPIPNDVLKNAEYPIISDKPPICPVKGYHHLGLAVSNKTNSINFYSNIGFVAQPETLQNDVTILRNKGGLELHIFTCDEPINDDKNLLMDYPDIKYTGHNHASFYVPNVEATRVYLESQGCIISGERKIKDKLFAIFSRDPDRNVIEFERNTGEADDVVITSEMIGYPQKIDHIGIRVAEPNEKLVFYAEKLGFNRQVKYYTADLKNPLKNGPPWITRTENTPHCDINFIINANTNIIGVTENSSANIGSSQNNILIKNNIIRPGIVYAGFEVENTVNLEEAYIKLKESGVLVVKEHELLSGSVEKWQCLKNRFVPSLSLFIEDKDGNIIRIVAATI